MWDLLRLSTSRAGIPKILGSAKIVFPIRISERHMAVLVRLGFSRIPRIRI